MKRLVTTIAGLLAVLAVAAGGPARAADPKPVPGLIYAMGQKFDKSFNETAYHGAEKFKGETGIAYLEFQPTSPAQFEQGVSALVRRGATDIVAVGFYYATPLADVAPKHPKVRFTLIDGVVDQPNVQSITFREHEGAFLAGMLAALTSKTGEVGFIGALDIPLLRKFATGFEEGAKYVKPDIGFHLNFVGTTPAAFNDPSTGAEVAKSQLDQGVDVIFAGAGSSNFGIFRAAADAGRFAIGVDSNQNDLHPGHILTSQLKRVDLAVIQAFQAGRAGTWSAGHRELGLAEGGVDYAVDQHNMHLLPKEVIDRVEAARKDIIEGRLKVTDAVAKAKVP